MSDEEILEIVNRLEQAVEFRKAKSHVEQLECRDHLRIRTNRDGCLSFAAAFLREAIEQTSRTMLTSEKCQTVEGHEQLYENFGLCVTDIQRFEDWGNLKNEIKCGQKKLCQRPNLADWLCTDKRLPIRVGVWVHSLSICIAEWHRTTDESW